VPANATEGEAKIVVPRASAVRDVEAALEHYRTEVSEKIALGFVTSLERGYRHIGRHPASGSSRFSHELNIPGLRSWPLRDYPYIVFYIERQECIDVWRVLHGQRDIPGWLRD
jgi:toxin ParE1/3/4